MVLYNGLCRSLNKKVDFNVEDVISMNTTRGIKWRVKGNYEGHNISTFCSEVVAQKLLSKLPLTMDAEIAYTPPSETYQSEELIPSFSNATHSAEKEGNAAEEVSLHLHEQIQENTNAYELDLHSEKLPSKYYKKDGSLDMRYKICKEYAAKQAESQNAVELEAPYTPIKPERPSDDSGGRDKNRRKPRRPLDAEDDMIICEGCNMERYSDVDFTIDNAREDVLDDGNVLCDYCWASHDKYVENAESFGADEEMIIVTNIDWETDGEEVDLPTTMKVPADLMQDEIADYLSDQTGWLVNGFGRLQNPRRPRGFGHSGVMSYLDFLEMVEAHKKSPPGERIKINNELVYKVESNGRRRPLFYLGDIRKIPYPQDEFPHSFNPFPRPDGGESKNPIIFSITNPDGITLKEVNMMFPQWDGEYVTWNDDIERGQKPLQTGFNYLEDESFEADDTNYADIEKLLESDEDVFLGGDDWNQYPEHPQKERIIEYLMQGGGGQTPYRVCFTCSKVTDDVVLINEGYECMPCSENIFNITDYEKRKWGSEDSLKYSYGGFQSEEVSQEANEVVYAEGVPDLQDAEAGIEAQYIQKKDQFMSVIVDDGTLYKLMPDLPAIVEISPSPLAGYNNLRFNFVENPEMEQKILSYAYTIKDNSEEEDNEPEYRAGDVRNRLFNVEFDDWAEQEMLTHGDDVSFKEWADEESDSHGDEEFIEWADHEEESHDEKYGAEDFTMQEADRYELGDNIITLSTTLKKLMHQDNTGNWDWQNVKKIGKGIKQGDFNRVKGHMDDIDIKTRRVLWDEYHEGLLQLFTNTQLHALAIPWVTDGYEAEESVWGLRNTEAYWNALFDEQMADWLEFVWANRYNFKSTQTPRFSWTKGNPVGANKTNLIAGLGLEQGTIINTDKMYKAWKSLSPIIQDTPAKRCLITYPEAVQEMHIFLDYMKDVQYELGYEDEGDLFWGEDESFNAEIGENELKEMINKFHKTIDSYTKGHKYTKCSSCEAENKIDSLEDNDGKILHYYYSCKCGHNDLQDSSYDAGTFEAEYTLNQMAKKSFREIDKISGFVADRLSNDEESWAKLSISERKKILSKIRKDEDGWFDLYSLDAESFENYKLLAEEAGGVFLIENNKGFNIEFENGYQVSVKFGAGHYSDNYEKNPIIEMGRYLESSTAEIAILRNGLLIPLDEEGHKKVKGWVPPSIIPPLLTAASEGDEEKIRSIIKEYEKSQQGAESFGAEDTKGYYEPYAFCEWCSDEIQKESDAVSMRGEIICKGCKEAWGEQPVDGGFGAESKVELKRDSCCCGATVENPCLCMKEGVMNCSSVEPKCPCYAAKDAESFDALGDMEFECSSCKVRLDPHMNENEIKNYFIKGCSECGANSWRLVPPQMEEQLRKGELVKQIWDKDSKEWVEESKFNAESFEAERKLCSNCHKQRVSAKATSYGKTTCGACDRVRVESRRTRDDEIFQLRKKGVPVAEISRRFRISTGSVHRIARRIGKEGIRRAESFAAEEREDVPIWGEWADGVVIFADGSLLVKVVSFPAPYSDAFVGESMWVVVKEGNEFEGKGYLTNDPQHSSLKFGTLIEYHEGSDSLKPLFKDSDGKDMITMEQMLDPQFKGILRTTPEEYLEQTQKDRWQKNMKDFEADEIKIYNPKFKGQDICVECGSSEIPLSEMDGGEIGLSDYYFSCAECDFSWYVAVRTDEHEDGSSAGIDFVGFMDEDGNVSWEPQEFNMKGEPNPAYKKLKAESFEATGPSVTEEMILDYLENSHRLIKKYNGPYKYTAKGIAEHFGVARRNIREVIGRMRGEGLIKEAKRRLEDSPTDYGTSAPISIYYLADKEIRWAESFEGELSLRKLCDTCLKQRLSPVASGKGQTTCATCRRTHPQLLYKRKIRAKKKEQGAEDSNEFIGRLSKNLTMSEKYSIKKNNVRLIFEEAQRPLYPLEVVRLYEQKKRNPNRNKKSARSITHTKGRISATAISRIVKSQPDIFYISRSGIIHYVGGGSMKEYIRDLNPKYFAEEVKNKPPSEEDIMDYLQYSHNFITKYSAPFKYSSWGMIQKYGVTPVSMRATLRRMEKKGLLKSVARNCDDLPDARTLDGSGYRTLNRRLKIYYHSDAGLINFK